YPENHVDLGVEFQPAVAQGNRQSLARRLAVIWTKVDDHGLFGERTELDSLPCVNEGRKIVHLLPSDEWSFGQWRFLVLEGFSSRRERRLRAFRVRGSRLFAAYGQQTQQPRHHHHRTTHH